ncbi:MAG: rod shape-determining protein MreC, partial [Aquificaceae bacterium]|nr:rod shape-determining protein MreC [Aquificaceae bacterium]
MKRHAVRLALLALGILIYQLKLSTLPILDKVYWALTIFLMPAYELKNSLETKAGELLSQYILLHNVQRENAILKRQIAELNTLSAELKVCKQELKTLSEHTGIKAEYSQIGALPARVLGYDPLGYDRFLLIDRGMSAGVERGMLVIVGEELLGVVDQVFAQSSRVKTLYSQGFSISVSVEDRAYIYRGGFPIG